MNVSIFQIIEALENLCILGGDKEAAIEELKEAQTALQEALTDMDGLTVAGRGALDTLLGCMMAVESMTGKGDENGR